MADTNRELADFLRRARAAVDPAGTGLPADGRIRRVPGLRREEVAVLAGVSADYYARLEQGRRIVPSESVVDAIADALGLDDAGRSHLRDLIGHSPLARTRRVSPVQRVRPALHQFLDSLEGQPAIVLGRRSDVLASNRLARALFVDFDRMPAADRNYAKWMLLSDDARQLFLDWDVQARAAVESLRLEAGNDPDDRATQELVSALAEASPEFRQWWGEHRVFQRTYGSKRLRHPIVGDLTVQYESLSLPGDQHQTLFVYSTEPASRSREALGLLASWAATAQAGDGRGSRV
ncbi:transcriptional regulator with XRE-family HTH domain [Microbacteriaceae bacterium SG_E_30_P1]|uniref:Transcriptional regulator with XRE-family HTH domain n=1 Tax=Antiquaquibacter oligotrophicus TaxID=2880260 RepID=A0ABT6KQK0_9MICO|nr:helix-turn-helix transcriptional regulator [Antiquaquibacter oligotrophicus]MDH6182081.1 transcriptional regulator with XRE-family HTH domain [Antiquaquibacter oligotrophicus]UDF12253.1 helix-turn-helix transcriptional regulator [Antiquaquibacter oligotrophicus]